MSTIPAVCPRCGAVHQLTPDALPEMLVCACGAQLRPESHGAAVLLNETTPEQARTEKPEVQALLTQAEAEKQPDKRYALYQKALMLDPDSFAVRWALLMHGRLHECVKRPGDFSVIKCYLLHLYEESGAYKEEKRRAVTEELFHSADLTDVLTRGGDAQRTMQAYLQQLSQDYIALFLRGRTEISHHMFGFARPQDDIAKLCATVVAGMRGRVLRDQELTEEQRDQLHRALGAAFEREFPGKAGLLVTALDEPEQPRKGWRLFG